MFQLQLQCIFFKYNYTGFLLKIRNNYSIPCVTDPNPFDEVQQTLKFYYLNTIINSGTKKCSILH